VVSLWEISTLDAIVCVISCCMTSFMYFHCARNALNHESPHIYSKAVCLCVYAFFKLYIIHDPCLNQMYTIMVYVCTFVGTIIVCV
jgi:hypothetical protein